MVTHRQGFGTSVTFGTTGFACEIDDVNLGGMAREDIDTSHMATTDSWETFEPSDLKNPGELTLNITFDPDEEPPLDEPTEHITIAYPNGKSWSCDGYMKSFSNAVPKKGKMTGTAVIKFSGEPSFTT